MARACDFWALSKTGRCGSFKKGNAFKKRNAFKKNIHVSGGHWQVGGHQSLRRKDGHLWVGALVSMAPFGFIWGTGTLCLMSLGWSLSRTKGTGALCSMSLGWVGGQQTINIFFP